MTTSPSADLALRLMDAIRTLVRRFSLAERADIACCGMTVAQAATLEALSGGDGVRLGELGRRLGIAPSTLSRNLDRLEDRGFVVRGPDPDDRRALRVSLTSAGASAAATVRDQEIEFTRTILEKIPKASAEATVAGIEDLLMAIRTSTETCCPGAYDHLFAGSGIAVHERTEE